MGTIAGILAAFAASHLVGTALGGILARFGLAGFGRKLTIARHVLRVGQALRNAFEQERSPRAREELKRWLEENDPTNSTGLADGIDLSPPPKKRKGD